MKTSRLGPLTWGILTLIAAQALTLAVAFRVRVVASESQYSPPGVSPQVPLAYFFGAVVVLGIILFLVPVSKLKIMVKILFGFLFGWGTFVVLGLYLPVIAAGGIAVLAGVVWLFWPRVWLHNLLLALALVSVGAVFGFILPPWTVIILMLAVAVYDLLAVRFGYMMWMARKLSESETLPAFILPPEVAKWNLSLKDSGFKKLFDERGEREFSILGGGDIGFPLLMAVSVLFAYGLVNAIIVAAFSLLGLAAAYLVQLFIVKGKPVPAMPTIFILSFIGFLIVYL